MRSGIPIVYWQNSPFVRDCNSPLYEIRDRTGVFQNIPILWPPNPKFNVPLFSYRQLLFSILFYWERIYIRVIQYSIRKLNFISGCSGLMHPQNKLQWNPLGLVFMYCAECAHNTKSFIKHTLKMKSSRRDSNHSEQADYQLCCFFFFFFPP